MADDSPWMHVSARDYEAHMAEIGQSHALRDIFARVYANTRPRRLLVLGCTTGNDFELVDPDVTENTVGVDLNPRYIEIARTKVDQVRAAVELVHGDVLRATLPCPEFDLVHAALLFEYVDPLAMFRRIAAWLAPDGVCSTVTQNPAHGVAPVSKTSYASLRALDGRMSLHRADDLHAFAERAGLERVSSRDVPLPLGKSFSVSTFRKAKTTPA